MRAMAWITPLALVFTMGCTDGLVPATGTTDDTDQGPLAELLGIGITPRDPAVSVGETVDFSVRAFYADTSNADISDQVTWISSDPRIATIDAAGRAQAVSPGEASIVATDTRGVGTRTKLVVKGDSDTPTALALAPRLVEVKVGAEVELQAVGTYADGSTGNLAASCTWSSDDPELAAVQAGRVTGVAEGRTSVRAVCGALDAAAPITVRAADAVLELPDLQVVDLEYEVISGDLWLLFDVLNTGDGMSDISFVDVFLDSDGRPDDDDTFVLTELIEALAPGERSLVLLIVEDLDVGDHTAWVVSDADGWVEETDDANNYSGPHPFTVTPTGGPELEVTTFEALTDGSYTYYTIEVENTGTVSARDFYIDLWYDPSTTPGVCDTGDDYVYVASLAPGASLLWDPDVFDGPSSSWLSLVWVDSCNDVVEADEDNTELVIVEE